MKLEGIIKRVSLARESKIKHIMPYDNFYEKFYSAVELVDFVKDEKAEKIRHEARKYLVITCASYIENYFKRMAQVFINAGWINDEFREILRQDFAN